MKVGDLKPGDLLWPLDMRKNPLEPPKDWVMEHRGEPEMAIVRELGPNRVKIEFINCTHKYGPMRSYFPRAVSKLFRLMYPELEEEANE